MRLSTFVSAVSWSSLVGLSWLVIFRSVEVTFVNGFLWVFFLLTAVVSGLISMAAVTMYELPTKKKGE